MYLTHLTHIHKNIFAQNRNALLLLLYIKQLEDAI